MAGKGDKRRPGTNYADNWERIFKRKQINLPLTVECCGFCGLPIRQVQADDEALAVCDDCGIVEGNTTQEEVQNVEN